jgi:CSLREA domain-containing protein
VTFSRSTRWLVAIVATFVVLALFTGARPVVAALIPQTYTVTRGDDPVPGACTPADCSLREAVIAANGNPTSTVALAARLYTLTIPGADAASASERIGDLDVRVRMTITGVGAGQTVIQAGNSPATAIHRIFDVSGRNIVFTKMTIQNGRDVENNSGGCVRNVGKLTLDTVIVKGCTSSKGGGGVSSYGNLTVKNSIITGNTVNSPTGARVNGGGITGGPGVLITPSIVTIVGTTISSNSATSAGNVDLQGLGGGFANTATMNITDSIIDGNSALNAGGGINVGDMTITRTAFTGNTSRYDVGALDNDVTMTINDSTFSGNTSGVGCVGTQCNRSFAGGVLNTANGTMFVNNTTFSGNVCRISGGGILNAAGLLVVSSSTIAGNTCGLGAGLSASDTTRIKNTIIGANTATNPQGGDCSGVVTSEGFNLIEAKTGCRIDGVATGNLIGPDPLLGPLKDNGGVTATMALTVNSPAINKGDPQGCKDDAGVLLPTDQRGQLRIARARCDMGAFELQP